MPVTGSTNLIASMSIAGIPPFNGFWSKLLIIVAAVQAGRYGYAFWAVLASVLTLASFMKVMKYAYYGSLNEKWQKVKEVPVFMKAGMIILAIVCIVAGALLMPEIRQKFLLNASDVLLQGVRYSVTLLKGMQ